MRRVPPLHGWQERLAFQGGRGQLTVVQAVWRSRVCASRAGLRRCILSTSLMRALKRSTTPLGSRRSCPDLDAQLMFKPDERLVTYSLNRQKLPEKVPAHAQ